MRDVVDTEIERVSSLTDESSRFGRLVPASTELPVSSKRSILDSFDGGFATTPADFRASATLISFALGLILVMIFIFMMFPPLQLQERTKRGERERAREYAPVVSEECGQHAPLREIKSKSKK